MSIGSTVVQRLRDQGHDVVHLRELKMQRATEEEVFDRARQEARLILTLDLDLNDAFLIRQPTPMQLLVIRTNDTRPVHVVPRVSEALQQVGRATTPITILIVDDTGVRSRGQ